ncbi:MAG: HEAT repeat domain-containing protein [Planctomycetes bacterium]|nr:HEAT repeat domain-containing protein [Planctomycetota bacterium]
MRKILTIAFIVLLVAGSAAVFFIDFAPQPPAPGQGKRGAQGGVESPSLPRTEPPGSGGGDLSFPAALSEEAFASVLTREATAAGAKSPLLQKWDESLWADLAGPETPATGVVLRRLTRLPFEGTDHGALLIPFIGSADREVRLAALALAGRRRAVCALDAVLARAKAAPEAEERAAAVRALGGIGQLTDAVREHLFRLIDGPDQEAQAGAVAALGDIGDRAVFDDLVERNGGRNYAYRAALLTTLGKLDHPNSAHVIFMTITGLPPEARCHACVARGVEALTLVKCNPKTARTFLLRLLENDDDEIRALALQALRRMDPSDGDLAAVARLFENAHSDRERLEALRSLRGRPGAIPAEEALLAAWNDPGSSLAVRRELCVSFARLRLVAAADTLRQHYGGAEVVLKIDILRALADLSGDTSRDLAREALDHPPCEELMVEAGLVLTVHGDAADIPRLRRAADYARGNGYRRFAGLAESFIKAIENRVSSPHPDVSPG